MEGFEPSYDGIKNRCLTAWRHPKKLVEIIIDKYEIVNRGCMQNEEKFAFKNHFCNNILIYLLILKNG